MASSSVMGVVWGGGQRGKEGKTVKGRSVSTGLAEHSYANICLTVLTQFHSMEDKAKKMPHGIG